MKPPKAHTIRLISVISLLPMAALAAVVLSAPGAMTMIAHGPLQEGHVGITCDQCHTPGPGSVRQQVQAKLRYAVGMRQTPVDFGYREVQSEQCLSCHERSNERHPIYRFREPRFAEAVRDTGADSCLGCHGEHDGHRLTAATTVCQACHGDLVMKNDPLDVPHVTLVATRNWDSCMGCHDFHGNHRFTPPKRLADQLPQDGIRAYLRDGPSPYGTEKIFEATTR